MDAGRPYVARLTRVEYARLVKAAAVGNMNCSRVWGGGIYENEAFTICVMNTVSAFGKT